MKKIGTHRPRKIPKNAMATAKYSALRVCIPRYALAVKAPSKVSDISQPSNVRSRLNHHSSDDDVAFVVSQHLTTSLNGYHTLHKWIDKQVDDKQKISCLSR